MDESSVETAEVIKLKGAEIKVCDSLKEALDTRLYEDLNSKVIWDEDRPYFSVKDPDFNLRQKTEAYGVVGKYFWEEGKPYWDPEGKPQKGTHFKLFKHRSRFYTALEHELGGSLSILQIMDAERINSKVTREGDFQWVRADHILLINKESGKVFDVTSLLPGNFVFRYVLFQPQGIAYAHSGKYSAKRPEDNYVQYLDLTTPKNIVVLFHEVGHILWEEENPDLAKEYMEIEEKWRYFRPREESLRYRELMIASERGASARALWLMRKLKKEGIDLGLKTKEARDVINKWLKSYEERYRLYPSEKGRKFTRRR